ncbi:hypothetical protein Pcinc_021481 [Petrolisthes cinctipes]|uniref:Uncharacterized protein n=1 Tax=Petrolisthes cinctipes TaxID=88211 RepID=A0AAE1FK23_PETCI|nr:hypothetical protein Pcinc_021481 [Petrolisthes cinctipes]
MGALAVTGSPQVCTSITETSTMILLKTPPCLLRNATHTTQSPTPSYNSHVPPMPPSLSSPRITTHHRNMRLHTIHIDSHALRHLSYPSTST